MQKKGDVWISAVLYFGIGIVMITILLTAGLPVINKLRDKNIIIQTKQVMHTLDDNIREVIKEGPGSQRVVTVNIKKGIINIDQDDNNEIRWIFQGANIPISEPAERGADPADIIEVAEGKIFITTQDGAEGKKYDVNIILKYEELDVDITRGGDVGDIVGIGDLVIRNNGVSGDNIEITISQANV